MEVYKIGRAGGPVDLTKPDTRPVQHSGFPSPANDHIERPLDLHLKLVSHPAATYFMKVRGDKPSLSLSSGDILVVDRSARAFSGRTVVAVMDGLFTVRRVLRAGEKVYLEDGNPGHHAFEITPESDITVWGVVTHIIHCLGGEIV